MAGGGAYQESETDGGVTVRYSATATAIGDDPATSNNFGRPQGATGTHEVIVHGNSAGEFVDGSGNYIPTGQIATAVTENPNYDGGPITVISCYSNCGQAAELEQIMGVQVTGFDGPGRLDGDGIPQEKP